MALGHWDTNGTPRKMGLLKEISKPKISNVATAPDPADSHPLAASSGGGMAVVTTTAVAAVASEATVRTDRPPCLCLRTRRVVTVGCDAAGELDWSTATQHRQCVDCGAIFPAN